jgi:hypothetical protein
LSTRPKANKGISAKKYAKALDIVFKTVYNSYCENIELFFKEKRIYGKERIGKKNTSAYKARKHQASFADCG